MQSSQQLDIKICISSIVMSVTFWDVTIVMIILLLATTSFLLEAVHGHVDSYALGLEVTGNDLEGVDEDHADWVGNW